MRHQLLSDLSACRDAAEYCAKFDTLEAAWLACERGDWLLWFSAKRGVDLKIIVRAACECARLALPHTKDPRVLSCIETAEKWTRGEATIEEVRVLRSVAEAAAASAAASAAAASASAAYAAYAAASAAASAADAAYAAASAPAAAAAYAPAAAAAYADAARAKVRAECAAIVRKHIPSLP